MWTQQENERRTQGAAGRPHARVCALLRPCVALFRRRLAPSEAARTAPSVLYGVPTGDSMDNQSKPSTNIKLNPSRVIYEPSRASNCSRSQLRLGSSISHDTPKDVLPAVVCI